MPCAVFGDKFTATIYQRQAIPIYMPLWMPATTLLQVAREGSMTQLSESLAYRLTFFTRNKYIHDILLSKI
jgi:hypothetical protein